MLRNRTLRAAVRDFGQHWPQLFLTIGVYNVIAVVLLTPLLALLSQILLRLSGKPVLADQDILFFLLQPAGWICAVTLGALWLCIIVLGQAALIGILAAPRFSNDSDSDQETKLGTVSAIQFAMSQTWQVSQITAWVIIRVGLLATPFLAIAGITYFFLLSEFDINFYLQAKPPKFIVAVGIGLALFITFIILLLRFLAGWLFALPMVLFENTPVSKAFQESSRRTQGLRSQIIRAVSIWLGTGLGLSAMTTSLLLLFGRLIIPDAASSLGLLVISLGIFVLVWTVVHILIQMTSSGLFASLWWNLYREFGCDDRIAAFGVRKPTTSRTCNDRFRITGTRLIVVSMLGLITAACIGIWTLNSVRLDDDVDIIAHRGASADAPENTLAAMNQAIEYSTDWVEIDVTDYVQAQKSAGNAASFAVVDTFMKQQLVEIFSREAADSADRPVLVVNALNVNATADTYVHDGSYAASNFGTATVIKLMDPWGDTSSTFNGGMEFDIMESLGIWGDDVTAHALHWDGYGGSHQYTGSGELNLTPSSDGYHTYGMYWEPGYVAMYVDGVQTWSYSNSRVGSITSYIILSLQMGGWDGNGTVIDSQLPADMLVDYVRVWSGTAD